MPVVKAEWAISTEGKIVRRSITEDEIDPGEALGKAFSSGVILKVKNMFTMPGCGMVNVAIDPKDNSQYWTIPLSEIVFKSTFKASGEGEDAQLVPTFAKAQPKLSIAWNVEQALAGRDTPLIRFVAQVASGPNGGRMLKQYIYAFSKDGNAYRMPMANVYDTGEICNGEYGSVAPTAFESVEKAIAQFRSAPYNTDLYYGDDNGITSKFFHFKPLKDGFQTLPIEGEWWKLCNKVSTANLKFVVL